jgi:hypothetical protein
MGIVLVVFAIVAVCVIIAHKNQNSNKSVRSGNGPHAWNDQGTPISNDYRFSNSPGDLQRGDSHDHHGCHASQQGSCSDSGSSDSGDCGGGSD